MAGKRARRNEVKVTIIETQYVETDSANFKSVVQKLTGKDSIVADSTTAKAAATASWSSHAAEQSVEGFGCCWGEDWFKDLMKTSSSPSTIDGKYSSSMAVGGSSWTTWSINGAEDGLWKLF